MGITETIAGIAVQLLGQPGFVGLLLLVFLMSLESMVMPVPSEAVMPFAGFLVFDGLMSWEAAIIFATIGSIIGSSLSYVAGYYGGKPFVRRFGKYLLLNEEHLDRTHRFFEKRGTITILLCRFIPVVRHLISIPAGFAKMRFVPFIVLTIIGAAIWNATLTVAGYFLRQNWNEIMKYSTYIDYIIVIALLVLIGLFFVKQMKRLRNSRAGSGDK